jgi:aminoglycoside phosphotransferase (APT) family kinase protein
MDYIEGRSVEECWDQLSENQRANIVSQVASAFASLQSAQVDQDPGPVDCKRCLCRGSWFTDMGAGPFGTIREMEDWFNRKLAICQHFKQAPDTVPPFCFERLVLTHQDIAPRNLILGSTGKVWLIDWGDAGIYPEGFEVAALVARRHNAPQFTDLLLEHVPKHPLAEQLGWIMYALTTASYIE